MGGSLTSFGEYSPEIDYKERDPEEFATEPISSLLADILKQGKVQLIKIYTAYDEIIIQGPMNEVRKVYTKWIKSN